MVTLAHAGAEVVALVTDEPRQESYAAFRLGAAVRWRVPVWTHTAVGRIARAADRLTGVELTDRGPARRARCRATPWCSPGTGSPTTSWPGWRALAMDPGTRGPVVDTTLATSVPGVFAAGNLVHAAETADVAALAAGTPRGRSRRSSAGRPRRAEGPRRAARARQAARAGRAARARPGFRSWWSRRCGGSRQRDRGVRRPPPLGRFVLRSADFRRGARLEVRQDGRLLARSRPARLIPARPVHPARAGCPGSTRRAARSAWSPAPGRSWIGEGSEVARRA